MSNAAAASVAAQAAARAAAAARQEEEEMTPYSQQDLSEGWKFKILRSATSRFGDPMRLRSVLQEEARAGWTLVEKFDNARVRLKRPVSARASDAKLDFDPYRTWVGTSQTTLALAIVFAIFGVTIVVGLIVMIFTN